MQGSQTRKQAKTNTEEYEVWPELDAQAVHTPERPFCWDMTCYCHSNTDAIQQVTQDVTDGLMSSEDANRFYRGKIV